MIHFRLKEEEAIVTGLGFLGALSVVRVVVVVVVAVVIPVRTLARSGAFQIGVGESVVAAVVVIRLRVGSVPAGARRRRSVARTGPEVGHYQRIRFRRRNRFTDENLSSTFTAFNIPFA